MKRMMMMALLAPALALCACGSGGVASAGSVSTPPANTQPISPVLASPAGDTVSVVSAAGDTVVLDSGKALLLAEDSYQGVAKIAIEMVDTGLIRGENATRLRVLNRQVSTALTAGVNAQTGAGRAVAAAQALAAIASIHTLLGK